MLYLNSLPFKCIYPAALTLMSTGGAINNAC